MKAIVYSAYGPPEVLELRETTQPIPKDDEVLVKIHAVSLNPADLHLLNGRPFFARLSMGLKKPRITTPGIDIAGVVEEAGKNVQDFKKGDEVFGGCGWGGGLADYVCVAEKNLVFKPANLSFEEAAAANVAAITALQGFRQAGRIQPGHDILINGASGGVGTFAVQIAKLYGAVVTGVCSAGNLDLVYGLGADFVIDYAREDFTRIEQKYDFILDAVGNRTVSAIRRALKNDGLCMIAGFTSTGLLIQHMIFGHLLSGKNGKRVKLMGTAKTNKDDLIILKNLLGSGKIKSVIDRTYPMNEITEAVRYLEKGHSKGKVVITL